MSEAYPVVILGAGLTGLSAAYHLGAPSLVIEREAEVGGLARTHIDNGFTLDCTGHLLHLKDPRVVALSMPSCRTPSRGTSAGRSSSPRGSTRPTRSRRTCTGCHRRWSRNASAPSWRLSCAAPPRA